MHDYAVRLIVTGLNGLDRLLNKACYEIGYENFFFSLACRVTIVAVKLLFYYYQFLFVIMMLVSHFDDYDTKKLTLIL